MNCSQCNFEVDITKPFCQNCGAPLNVVEESNEQEKQNEVVYEKIESYYTKSISDVSTKHLLIKKLPQLIGVIVSVIVIIMGIITINETSGFRTTSSGEVIETEYEYYGGDAYTGMQQASADASNNAAVTAQNVEITNDILNDISNDICSAIGMLIISIGLLGSAYFVKDLLKNED